MELVFLHLWLLQDITISFSFLTILILEVTFQNSERQSENTKQHFFYFEEKQKNGFTSR